MPLRISNRRFLVLTIYSRMLLPAAALTGSIYLLLIDTSARVTYTPVEFPVGVITALAGGPFFLYLLRMRKGE